MHTLHPTVLCAPLLARAAHTPPPNQSGCGPFPGVKQPTLQDAEERTSGETAGRKGLTTVR